ncbi:MAG: 30S ribosomal protein S20 [Succiniclasticum sp.]|nr:30S ribosomal protein S20 [Succiniclasticum ruminis]MEE3396464.1 30S ribosomal protein S20 [Succiniclasticum sp.]MEE3455565.1 30S ribosomal protein S20 [Succiniclasticum sp.]
MNPLPNIKSSIRSVKTDAERRAKNAAEKSAVRTAAKKVEAQVAEGNKAEAEVTLKKASSLLDKAAQSGVISKNAAARKKSKLAKKVNAAE